MSSRTLRSQKKQTRLQFAPLPSSSPAKDQYSSAVQGRLANLRYADSRRTQSPSPSGSQTEAYALPTPKPSAESQAVKPYQASSSSPLSDPPSSSPLNRVFDTGTPNDGHRKRGGDEERNCSLGLSSSKRRKPDGTTMAQASSPSAQRLTRLRSKLAATTTGSSTVLPISSPNTAQGDEAKSAEISDLGGAETSSDEDIVIATRPTRRRRSHLPKVMHDNFIVDDDKIESTSSEEDPITPSKSRKLHLKHNITPTARRRSQREQLELEEDLEDLQDSDTPDVYRRLRDKTLSNTQLRRKDHLELLKRRRAGELNAKESTHEEESEPVDMESINRISNPDSYSSAGSLADSSEESEERAHDTNSENDDDDDDFIVDDPTDPLGAPHPDIPLEFTSYASAKPKELFIHVIEWLVKNKISPAFPRHDQIWTIAFNKINDEVKAQAGSRLISSAWNAPFRRTLEARPDLRVYRMPGHEEDYIQTCDACNRANHPAQYDFLFSGQAYSHKTLEPIDNSDTSDDDRDHDNDSASLNSRGQPLAPATTHFYLGRYCAANAQLSHRLSHWLFRLNANLLAHLEDQGLLSAEAIIARDRKNHRKREREAEEIVDGMREMGVVEGLFRGFKDELDDARVGMEGFERRGGRGRGRHRVGTVRVVREAADGDLVGEDVGEPKYREAPEGLVHDSE